MMLLGVSSFIRNIRLARWMMLLLVGSISYRTLSLGSSPLLTASSVWQSCPASVLDAKGVHSGIDTDPAFDNVVLLVAANHGYRQMLDLWERIVSSQSLSLRYVIVAMDRQLYHRLLSRGRRNMQTTPSVLLATHRTPTGASDFRSPAFNSITCNKMRVVLDILQHCKTDVVFSDVDNIFLKDPFQGELGSLIRSGKFDYIYQHNDPEGSASCWRGDMAEEGNTGFYYLSHTAHSVHDVIRRTLEQCEQSDNDLDDQTLFWNVMRQHFHRKSYSHCDENGERRVFPGDFNSHEDPPTSMCCLDSERYPIGVGNVTELTQTYHANFLVGKESKMNRIRQVLKKLNISTVRGL